MKFFSTLSALALAFSHLSAQDSPAPQQELTPEQKALVEKQKQLSAAFSNLPEKKREEYIKLRADAIALHGEKRVFEAFGVISQLEQIFPDDPQIINLRGACYVEIRDFKKAREQFKKGIELTGENFNLLFNLAEISFVSKEWTTAIAEFDALLKKFPDMVIFTKQLIEFKIFICLLKASDDTSLSEEQRSAHLKRAESYVGKYTRADDSPYFYYVNCIMASRKNDPEESTKWLSRGRRIFSYTPQILAAWEDTLQESEMLDKFVQPDAAPGTDATETPEAP